ncbi:MAG: cell division protein FtsZ, partial [Patescibacteria group bacterium]|nr:cell division protein FtsZ [Patescibacteria group bacterium]
MAKKLKKTNKKSLPKTETEKVSPIKRTKIKVVGIGGGGGNIVSELAQRVKKATFLAANTDLQALKEISRKVECFPFGQDFTHGLGTGMNPEIAEMASQNEKERIKKILQGQDLVIFIACLGGGVGSGAAPIFAKISQNLGNLSYGIFTLPFKFEGERKMEIAKKTLEILRPKLNAITILPNERIFQVIDKTTPLKEAFSAINKSLAQSLEGLIETIYQPGLINIDFSDLRTILTGSRGRLAYLNTLSLPRKEGAAKEVIDKVLTSPLYPYGIKGAKGVLFNIVGEKGLSLEEVSWISKTISEKTHKEAKIIFGTQPLSFRRGAGYQNIIKTTIFATGCPTKIFSSEVPKKSRGRKIKQPVEKPAEKKKKTDAEVKRSSKVKAEDEARAFSDQPPKVKKVKLKKPEKKLPLQSEELQEKEEINKVQRPEAEIPKNPPADKPSLPEGKVEIKIRKNTLQLKKDYNPPSTLQGKSYSYN